MAEPSNQRPPALVASFVLGIVGAVLLVLGAVTNVEAFLPAGAGVAALSLIAALVWRSQLIDAWRKERGQSDSG